MANNKVQLADGTVLMDLTSDTVTPQSMILGATAHDASGEQITGVVELANAGTNTPLVDSGSGSVGTSDAYAREDHVHPDQGQGYAYGTCSTAASTKAKVVNATGYRLVSGGTVTVFFMYAVPANATLNVNSTGAKSIQVKTANGIGVIAADTINAGDIATFVYTGSAYMLIQLGSRLVDRAPIASPALTGTPTAPTAASGTDTTQIATTAFVQQEITEAHSNFGDIVTFSVVEVTT